ncbi:ATP-binding protein [Lysobacter sp. KIS68-7]|uniref:sensor histidine kinase n=1 Tax=Lysobacter sp. KIS68-7 TaxID=2904252 RepID=UPI001E5535FE|nr:ATP-binding protein [Lysobacter sp. KIS68-7]UHQ18756.1 ATP-binding protein [Lysobacter sp. KIS68-7]
MNAEVREALAQEANEPTDHASLLERQRDILEAIVRGDPLCETLAALCRVVEAEAIGRVRASIFLVDPDKRCLRTGAAPSLPEDYNAAVDGIGIAPGVGTCADAAATGRVVVTRDFATAPSWEGLRHLPMAIGLHAAWSMPILGADGSVLGTFGTYFPETREPTAGERDLVAVASRTAALAIEHDRAIKTLQANARTQRELLARERENARLLARVAEAARTIHGCATVDRVLRATAEASCHILEAQVAIASLTPDEDGAPPLASTSYSQGTLTVADAHSWLVARMVGHDGTEIGQIQVGDRVDGEFGDADQAILRQFAQIAAVALENAQLYERLREQDRRKDEFLAMLAHELRNPLAPIRTSLHILRMTDDPAVVSRSRDVMERQLAHLIRLVDDLLDVSRITRGKVTLNRERLDLRDVVVSALELARPLIDANAHRLAVTLPDGPLPIDGDRTRLAQVLANLLNNAAKYTQPGGDIALLVDRDAHAWRLRVRDDGIGIPRDMLARVFDMFTQIDQSIDRAQGGLGIGLTLVRRLVQLHGGEVSVESEGTCKGSTFTVRLPAVST